MKVAKRKLENSQLAISTTEKIEFAEKPESERKNAFYILMGRERKKHETSQSSQVHNSGFIWV